MNKIKNIKSICIYIMLLCVAVFYSCEQKETTLLEVSTREILLDVSGYNETEAPATFVVTSDKSWHLTSFTWLIPSIMKGEAGETEVSFYATPTTKDRIGYITVHSGDQHLRVTVNQTADELVPTTLTVVQQSIKVDEDGLTADGDEPFIRFSTNKKWTISNLPGWVTAYPLSGNPGTDITVDLSCDKASNARVSNILINAGQRSETVTLRQGAGFANLTGLLQNTQEPFQMGNVVCQGRFYEAIGWKTNEAAYANGNVDGQYNNGRLTLWTWTDVSELPTIENAKLYQTVELNAGTYRFDVLIYRAANDPLYAKVFIAIALGDDLPDIDHIEQDAHAVVQVPYDIPYHDIAGPPDDRLMSLEFELTEKSTVSLGFVGNIYKDTQFFVRHVELWGEEE